MSLFYGLLFIFPVWSTENVLKRLPGLSWMENPKSTYEGDSRLACVRSVEDKHVWWLQMLTSMEVNERAEQDSSAYGRQLPLYNQLQGKKTFISVAAIVIWAQSLRNFDRRTQWQTKTNKSRMRDLKTHFDTRCWRFVLLSQKETIMQFITGRLLHIYRWPSGASLLTFYS